MGYNGKFSNKKAKRRMSLLSWVLLLAALLSVSAGSVVAYLSLTSGSVANTFSAESHPAPVIQESFDSNVKSSVYLDVGELGYAVYVRAAVVVTWKDAANGNVYGKAPAASDYTISIGSGWKKGADSFYYCLSPVLSKADTPILIESCKLNDGVTPPEGYDLNVEIITQTIQALGTTDDGGTPAVTNAWGISIGDDGKLNVS